MIILSFGFAFIFTLLYFDFAKYLITNGLVKEYKRDLILYAVVVLICWVFFFYVLNN